MKLQLIISAFICSTILTEIKCQRECIINSESTMVCTGASETILLEYVKQQSDVSLIDSSLQYMDGLFENNNQESLKKLQINKNRYLLHIKYRDVPLTYPINLEELELSNLYMRLFSGMFQNFLKLKKLTLFGVRIPTVFHGLFDHADNLEYLKLSDNKIENIEKNALFNLKNLKYLDLSKNLIKSFDSTNLVNAINLEQFHMEENPLMKFNLLKLIENKALLKVINMHGIFCNTFKYSVQKKLTEMGYNAEYVTDTQCTYINGKKCNVINMKKNDRKITIAENEVKEHFFDVWYEMNIYEGFSCLDDCSTNVIPYFPENDVYAEQMAANILTYYKKKIQNEYDDLSKVIDAEKLDLLTNNLQKLSSLIEVADTQVRGQI